MLGQIVNNGAFCICSFVSNLKIETMKKSLHVFMLLLLSSSFVFAQKAISENKVRIIDSLFNSLYEKGKLNGNALIAEKGKIIYLKSFGYANEQTKAQLNENSIFELASCSKQFTAMAIALLQHQGKLSFDDKISKFIPELSHYKDITIAHLIHHTSGLPDYMGLEDSIWQKWDETKIATNNDIIKMFEQYKPKLLFEPNTKHEYSNTGYAFLASIIERASKMTYAAYLDAYIFKPLGMNRSFVYTRRYAPRNIDNYAFGYVMDDSLQIKILPDSSKRYGYVYCLDGIVGDGTVNSTVKDFLKWDRALYTDKLLPLKERNNLFASSKLNNGEESGYGFGWFIKEDKEFGKRISHTGGWPGYVNYIERYLDSDKTIILLQNTQSAAIPSKEIRLALHNKAIPAAKVYKEMQIADSISDNYIGRYQLAPDFILSITKEGGQMYAQATGQNKLAIYAASDTTYFSKEVAAEMNFVTTDGKVKEMIFSQGGQKMTAAKID